jgi:hypothetical protein
MLDNQMMNHEVRKANGRSKRTETRAILYDIAVMVWEKKGHLAQNVVVIL